jgi:hypothetical protein
MLTEDGAMMRGWMGLLATLASGFGIAGCTHWKTQPIPVAQVLEENPDRVVRLDLEDGQRIEVHHPHLSDGNLIGNPWAEAVRTVRIPVRTVEAIAVRRFNAPKTAAFGLLFVIGFVLYESLYPDGSTPQ